MMKSIAQILLLGVCTSTVQAQSLKIGLELGASASLTRLKYDVIVPSFKIRTNVMRYGVRIGLPLQYTISQKTSFYSGVFYSTKGSSKTPKLGYAKNIDYSTIELPLALVYTKQQSHENTFFVGGGIYFGYAFNGTLRSKGIDGDAPKLDAHFGNDRWKDDIRRLEYGIHFQTGKIFHNGLLLRFVAQRQLNNLAIKDKVAIGYFSKIKNQVLLNLSLGYLLEFKHGRN